MQQHLQPQPRLLDVHVQEARRVMSANAALQRPAAGHVDGVQGAQPSPQGPGAATDVLQSIVTASAQTCCSSEPAQRYVW